MANVDIRFLVPAMSTWTSFTSNGEFGNEAITKKSAEILANEETEMQYGMSHRELDS